MAGLSSCGVDDPRFTSQAVIWVERGDQNCHKNTDMLLCRSGGNCVAPVTDVSLEVLWHQDQKGLHCQTCCKKSHSSVLSWCEVLLRGCAELGLLQV